METDASIPQETFFSGQDFLKSFLERNPFDLSVLKEEDFALWIKKQIEQKSTDPSFYKRCEIRDLHNLYRPQFTLFWKEYQRAYEAWDSCPSKARWEHIEKRIFGIQRALEGLTHAIEEKTGVKRLDCITKLEAFQKELSSLEKEKEQMMATLSEKYALDKAEKELWQFKEEMGLNQKEKELKEILHEQAVNTTHSGSHYESIALDAIEKYILPSVSESLSLEKKASLRILSNVTLGCARAEIDYLVVLPSSEQVLVLAMIEVKRNINDLAHGFLVRQENLAWFTGDSSGYDIEQYRTRQFKEGLFDKTICHEEKGEKFFFNKDSFSLFQKEGDYFFDGLFFITDIRSLLGMLSAEYRKVLYRISTDLDFDLDSKDYIQKLFSWARDFISPIQTKHVLEWYAKKEKWAKQIVFCSRKKKE